MNECLVKCSLFYSNSTIIPERLDAFINKYAEHTHDKWAFEKVSYVYSSQLNTEIVPYLNRGFNGYTNCINFQIQNNWTYGEVLDEDAKTHPMLRPYKTFSEKVTLQNITNVSCQPSAHYTGNCCQVVYDYLKAEPSFCWSGQGNISMANQRVHQSHVGLGVDPGESQGWGGRS